MPLLFSGDSKGVLRNMEDNDDDDSRNRQGEERGRSSLGSPSTIPRALVATDDVEHDDNSSNNIGNNNDGVETKSVSQRPQDDTPPSVLPEKKLVCRHTLVSGVQRDINRPICNTNDMTLDRVKTSRELGGIEAAIGFVAEDRDNVSGGNASADEASSDVDDDNDWGTVDVAERKGYAGAAVERAAVSEGVDGLSLVEVNKGGCHMPLCVLGVHAG